MKYAFVIIIISMCIYITNTEALYGWKTFIDASGKNYNVNISCYIWYSRMVKLEI